MHAATLVAYREQGNALAVGTMNEGTPRGLGENGIERWVAGCQHAK